MHLLGLGPGISFDSRAAFGDGIRSCIGYVPVFVYVYGMLIHEDLL